MATAKEILQNRTIDHVFYQPKEIQRGEQNSFLRFIDENRDLFEKHSSLTYELRDEEQGWKDSETFDSIIKINVDLTLPLAPKLNNMKSKTMNKLTRRVRTTAIDLIFGNSNEVGELSKKFSSYYLSSKFRPKPESEALIKTMDESFEDYRTSFREATLPLAVGVRESKAELIKKFEDFLLLDSSNLFAFQDFLSDKKNYGADKEAIRPFLASLVETERNLVRNKKEGIVHRSVEKWANELKENPTHAVIDELTASIKSPAILEWLEFAARGEDIANFLKSCPDVSTWPSDLKNALSVFVGYKYHSALSSIGKDMEQFGRPLAKSTPQMIDLELEEGTGKATAQAAKVVIAKKEDKKKGKLEKAEKEKYPVGILTKEVGSSFKVSVLTEEELTGYLQKEADSLASSDIRMMKDLKDIFANLQKDSYGLGTKKLTDKFVGVGNRSLPLRSINPGKRIGLSLDHPESTRIRIVYVIYRNEVGPVIGIEGIYKHEDYDKKFIS